MVEERLARIEAKLDALLALYSVGTSEQNTQTNHIARPGGHIEVFYRQFTVKQNATMQMLMRGATNEEIATRFNVTENTAKVYVRSIAKKLGVNTRAQIVIKAIDAWQLIDDNSYRLVTGGLPKDWDETFELPDPFAKLYGGNHEP